ncbi:unnamed protein product [marine sediment metagenome]|uniref:Uncharacterized protein n=1 Tax=marine sediment metagenome TaxID=412755 RepID=X1G9G7_9ZZZZ
MNGEISELLKKYGTSLAETRKLIPELGEAVKRGREDWKYEVKPPAWPTVTQFFTAEDVKGMGLVTATGEPFELDPGWRLRVAPPVDGQEPKFSYITPEDWEYKDVVFSEGELINYTLITPTGERYTKQQYEAYLAEIEATQTEPEIALTEQAEIKRIFGEVFREYKWMTSDIEQTLTWLYESKENQLEFLNLVRAAGRDEDTEALLKMLFRPDPATDYPGITPEEMATVFGEVPEEEPFLPGTRITSEGMEFVIEVGPEGEKVRKLALLKPDATVWMEGKRIGTLNPETGLIGRYPHG